MRYAEFNRVKNNPKMKFDSINVHCKIFNLFASKFLQHFARILRQVSKVSN